MIRGKCPLCGSLVSASEAKSYSRLACNKCHTDLHVGKDGSFVIGEPPDVDLQYQDLKREIRHLAGQFPTRKVVTGLAVLLILGLGLYSLFGPVDRLDSVAEQAARAIADDDQVTLESLAVPGTTDDLRRGMRRSTPSWSRTARNGAARRRLSRPMSPRRTKSSARGPLASRSTPS